MVQDVRIEAVRRFNRFYTREVGLLRRNFLGTSWTLGEMRVLYEIWIAPGTLAKDIASRLDLDTAYLSRLLSRMEKLEMIERQPSSEDARQLQLFLTTHGAGELERADGVQKSLTSDMLNGLSGEEQEELTGAMACIERLIGKSRAGR